MPVLRRLAPIALLAAVLAGSACPPDDAPANTGATAEVPVPDAWTLAAIESLGDHALLVAVVRPEAWPAVSARLAPLALRFGGAAPARATLLLAGELSVFLHMLFGPDASAKPTLTGLDPARPVVLALDEPAMPGPPGLLVAGLLRQPGALPGLRHELVLPAADPAGLAGALARWFDALGRQEPALAAGRAGATAWVLASGDLVAVVAEAETVRVVGLQRVLAPPDTPIASVPPEVRGELLRASPPAPPRTAGVMLAAAGSEPLSVLLRPRVLPGLLQWQRARAHADALAQASHVDAAPRRRSSLAGLLRCEQAFGDAAVDLDEWLLTAGDDPHGVRLRVAGSLSPAGAQLLDASQSTRELLELRVPAIVSAGVRLDLADAGSPKDAGVLAVDPGEALVSCLDVLPYMSLGTPFSSLRRSGATPPNFGAQLAITALDVEGVRGAVTLDLPATSDAGALRTIAAQVVTLFGSEPELQVVPAGDRQRLLVGAGVDPGTVFADTTVPAGLVSARVDLSTLAPAIQAVAPELGAALVPYRRAALDLARTGPLLLGELTLDDGEPLAARPPLAALTADATTRASSPTSPGLECARTFATLAAGVLADGRENEAKWTRATVETRLAGLEPTLACIENDPATAASAPVLRRVLRMTLADALVDELRPSDAASVLTGLCEAGDAIACRRRAELELLPDITLPGLHSNCPTHHDRYAHRLTLAGDRLALDDRPVVDAADLARRLSALAEDKEPSLELAIDAATPFAALRPLLAALSLRLDLRLGIVSGHDRGLATTYRIPMVAPQIAASSSGRASVERLPQQQRVGALVLAADGTSLRMRTGTTALGTYPYLHATTIEADARERPDNGRPPMVTATETTPWNTVAVALAGTCSPHVLVEDRHVHAQLGPPDRTVSILWDPHGPKALSVKPKVRGPNNINSGLFSAKPRVEYCYGRGLADDPTLAGKVVIELAVSAAGELGAVTVASSTLKNATVERCIVDAIQRHTFWSSADEDVVIRWQFDLRRG